VVYAGFSQGAILATHLTLRLEESPAALCIFSGAIIAQDLWQREAPKRKGLKVLQSHGLSDPILPFLLGQWVNSLLSQAGLQVDFCSFQGGHTIPETTITKFLSLLNSLCCRFLRNCR